MLKAAVFANLLVAGLITVPAASEARPVAPGNAPAISNIMPAQGRWERCNWLRGRIRELEGGLYNAPPWERPRVERALFERRHEFRESCRRY